MVKVKLFKASWCGYCREFENEWDIFRRAASDLGIETETLDVDEPDDKVEFIKESIRSFPTIKVYEGEGEGEGDGDGNSEESWIYRGKRSAEGLLDEIL